MSVLLQTSLGEIKLQLFTDERPKSTLNFLKLCKIKYYNNLTFYHVDRNFIAQTGDPEETGRGGASIFAKLYGDQARYFDIEKKPLLKHRSVGTLSMANNGSNMLGSQFFLTLGEDLDYLDQMHCVFGKVIEGFDVLMKFNDAICDEEKRPYQDIIITHTVILEDPFDDPAGLEIPEKSPEPQLNQQRITRIGAFEKIDDNDGKSLEEIEESIKDKEAKARATILEMVGDIPDAEVKPPDTVLFVCKLNPVTTSQDLETIFSRFGNILSCEVIKDQKTGDSLQYAFIEFEKPDNCEDAYFKMNNVIIDDRRIHVDFSQSVAKLKYQKSNKPLRLTDNDNTSKVSELAFEDEEVGKAVKDVLKEKNRKPDGHDAERFKNRSRESWKRKIRTDSEEEKHNNKHYSEASRKINRSSKDYLRERPHSESRNKRYSPSREKYYRDNSSLYKSSREREPKSFKRSSPQERGRQYSSSPNHYSKKWNQRSPSYDLKRDDYQKQTSSSYTFKKAREERGRSPKKIQRPHALRSSSHRQRSSSSGSLKIASSLKRKCNDSSSSSSSLDNFQIALKNRRPDFQRKKDARSSPEIFHYSKKHSFPHSSKEYPKNNIKRSRTPSNSPSSASDNMDESKKLKSSKMCYKRKHPKDDLISSSSSSETFEKKSKKHKKKSKKKKKKHKKHSKKNKRSSSSSSSSS